MTSAVLSLLLGSIVILAIIAVNGYFVAQEFAYMSVDRSRLRALAEGGDKRAKRALEITRRTSFMLSGAQLGITVTGLLVGFAAQPLVGASLGVLLGGVGIPAAVSVSVGTVLALLVATVVQMIFGELYPKNLAIANAEPMARALARSTQIYLAAFGWLIVVFDRAAEGLLKLAGIEPVHDLDSTATAEDLGRIVAESRESGDLSPELSVLIDRILDFPDQDVAHAMVPRTRTDTVTPDTTVGELRFLMSQAHTRYPVISAQEEPLGVVQLTDLLHADVTEDATAASVMRPALLLPTVMSLPDALDRMVGSDNQLACVIDEYGGFAGVLTTEDLAEELVGEITDEHDVALSEVIVPEVPGVWRMAGDVHLDEVERAIGHDLPPGDHETIAGLVVARFGGLPEVGQVVRIELPEAGRDLVLDSPVRRSLEVEVLEVVRHVPGQLRVRLVATEDEEQR